MTEPEPSRIGIILAGPYWNRNWITSLKKLTGFDRIGRNFTGFFKNYLESVIFCVEQFQKYNYNPDTALQLKNNIYYSIIEGGNTNMKPDSLAY